MLRGYRRAVQEYTCPSCSRTYTTLHAAVLIKSDGLFHCEDCNSVLEAGGAEGHGDALNRRERTKLVKAKQVCTPEVAARLILPAAGKLSLCQDINDCEKVSCWQLSLYA